MPSPTPLLPDAGAGWSISLLDAARELDITPDNVVDLVRSSVLAALVVPANLTQERPPLRFNDYYLSMVVAALKTPNAPEVVGDKVLRSVSEIHTVAAALRLLLERMTPVDTEHAAIQEGRPLLAFSRGRRIYAHVRAEWVTALALDTATGRARVKLSMPSSTREILLRLGLQLVRGIRPVGEDKQTWRNWWRVPTSMWSVDREDLVRIDDLPALGGTPETDDVLDGVETPERGVRDGG